MAVWNKIINVDILREDRIDKERKGNFQTLKSK